MGAIISHAYLASGILPIRIALPCISAILLPPGGQLPQNVLVETFIDCLSCHDASIFKDAFEEVKAGKKIFPPPFSPILCLFLVDLAVERCLTHPILQGSYLK